MGGVVLTNLNLLFLKAPPSALSLHTAPLLQIRVPHALIFFKGTDFVHKRLVGY